MTGPRGGKTTVTPSGLRRTNLDLAPEDVERLDAFIRVQAERSGRKLSRSEVVRRLIRRCLAA